MENPENIPSFSMWKMFNDIIPVIINMESSESNVKSLTNILRLPEFSDMFLYNMSSTSTNEYEEMTRKYKSFTVWLLGRLFYLLSQEKLLRIHSLIIDTQKRILHSIEITQGHIYHELSTEYIEIFKQLNTYVKSDYNEIVVLKAFVPEIHADLKDHLDLSPLFVEVDSEKSTRYMQKVVMQIIEQICLENIQFYYITTELRDILENLLFVLLKSSFGLKIQALGIYSKLLINRGTFPADIQAYFNRFFVFFENLFYNYLNGAYRREFAHFEEIGVSILKESRNTQDTIKIFGLCKYIVEKKIENKIDISVALFDLALKNCAEEEFVLVDDIWETKKYDQNILRLYKNQIIREIISYLEINPNLESNSLVLNAEISQTWMKMYQIIIEKLQLFHCTDDCLLNDNLKQINQIIRNVADISFVIKNKITDQKHLEFVQEGTFLPLLISYVAHHTDLCSTNLDYETFNQILFNTMSICRIQNIDIFFHLINFAFLRPLIYNTHLELPANFVDYIDMHQIKKNIRLIYSHLAKLNIDKSKIIGNLCCFGVYFERNENCAQLRDIVVRICTNIVENQDAHLSNLLCENIPFVLSTLTNLENFIGSILLPLLNSQDILVLKTITKALPSVLKIIYCKHSLTLRYIEADGDEKYICTIKDIAGNASLDSPDTAQDNVIAYKEHKPKIEKSSQIVDLFKVWIKLIRADDNEEEIRLDCIRLFPIWAKHTKPLHQVNIIEFYMVLIEDPNLNVRKTFADVIFDIMNFSQNNSSLNINEKNNVIETIFAQLLATAKRSLQGKFELQETLLRTIRNIIPINNDLIPLKIMQLLLYFIMMPTSKQPLIAVNTMLELPKKHNSTIIKMYSKYRRDLCQTVINLCAVNQGAANFSLATSLEKISFVFGFFGPKDFVSEECRYLLPFLVALIIKIPEVGILMEEMATLNDLTVAELLSSKYGYIFLHLYLNDFEVSKKGCQYVERRTGLDGSTLRKRNFMIILNELLLNFYEKEERVICALTHLAKEDSEDLQTTPIPDFLQPRFLGVLQYFDFKLVAPNSAKEKVLQSLARIFEYMGPTHITPLRFKIIAMLRTALNLNFPSLLCDAWNAFVRSCDIEVLGPQLATIFVSVLPLRATNPRKTNGIFNYLAVQNLAAVKDHICDLFFAVDFDLDNELIDVIREELKPFEDYDFKMHLTFFMKYLNYDTVDVRIYALKYIKQLLEKYREDLDQMILGYNGIDKVIVELLDLLTLGCREHEPALRLACGECIGELGAIEPSHLPRRYGENENSFSFYITDDDFILNSLNELIRALQAEKNKQNMDRFALAIQETLKNYKISPDSLSPKHSLWKLFPESQQEIMLPLLSSKYTMALAIENITVSPIYGSNFGSNFQSWIYSWTVSLVSAIKSDKKQILLVYMPSMKQDHKTLMHFLPHILFYSLTEGTQQDQKLIYDELMAVINSQNTATLADNILNVRPIRTENFVSYDKNNTFEAAKTEQYTKVVFIVLDFLDRWLREWLWDKGSSGRDDASYKHIRLFLMRFCKLQLAKCNFECAEYPRAVMYLEDYMSKKPKHINENLSLLADIYYRLDEPDGVAGVTALRETEPTLEERILALEVSGKFTDAAACYERIRLPMNLFHIQGLIRCYLDLDNVNTALNFAQGALVRQPEYTNWMIEAQAEPLWRLGRYDDLDNLLKKSELKDNDSWGVQIGHALLHLKNGGRDEFKNTLTSIKSMQVNALGDASLEEGAYQHGYQYIARLHALTELEQVEKVVYELLSSPHDRIAATATLKKLKMEWDLRIKVVQESVRVTEPILCLRRVAIEQAKRLIKDWVPSSGDWFDTILGESWLRSAEIARAAEVHQQAYTYTLKAEQYAPPKLFLEKAKLHWMREEHEQALTTLKRGLAAMFPSLSQGSSTGTKTSPTAGFTLEQKKICAEAKLLIATYNDDISNVDTDVNIQHYKEALEMFREWEKSLVCLGQYYDRVFQNLHDDDKDAKHSDMQIHMINYFGKSLQYGSNYVYQSMPRLLSIWFDYGTRILDVTESKLKDERKTNLLKMTKLIDMFLERLPTFIFLTAFSQLVSRICHPQKEVYLELKLIIIKIILQYPQHSLWMIISVVKSSYALRSKRCSEILSSEKLKTPTMIQFLSDFTKMAEKLIELCNKEISESVNNVSISMVLRTLPRMLTKSDFSQIMIPTQMFRKLVLPNPDFHNVQHNPFPNHYVHIIGIEDDMIILQSLQRPRRITFKGSDGKGYVQMLKPKDDLRKDFRLMEFNDIVNQMLSREADSRQRRLNIRLYSVAPLNEECGLIEWIPNLVGIRPICLALYKQRAMGMKGKELKEMCCKQNDTLEKKRNIFTDKLLPRHPPIMGEWFRKMFPDPQGWLTARTNYIRTTAVISMVGYILGLGDRHGENILLDSASGDTVHVDFNCLFNKGETFEWPERVPFRLTQNMVAAMGPLGVEGVFRKSCACTLLVLRKHTNTLMSIVTPFVYDPLVSWPRNAPAAANALNAERTNELAVTHIRKIECRLKGQISTKSRSCPFSIPLSVEGQTNNLIVSAMSLDNLCQMYIGWGPYL